MRSLVTGFVVAAFVIVQAQVYAGAPASNASAGWYYVPGGSYMLVPAGPNAPAVTSAIPGAVVMPAGFSPAAAPAFVAPSNAAPYSWQHCDQNYSDWSGDHGG